MKRKPCSRSTGLSVHHGPDYALSTLFDQCRGLNEGIKTLEAEIVAHARRDDTARRLATIPGIGTITASLIAATVADIGVFPSARHFAALERRPVRLATVALANKMARIAPRERPSAFPPLWGRIASRWR